MLPDICIRPMTERDIPRLAALRPGFVSPTTLVVEKDGDGLAVGWRLVERPLPEPYDKGDGYDFYPTERGHILARLRRGDGLHLVVESEGALVGVLDVAPQEWNNTAWIWNLMLDSSARGQGLGRELFRRTVTWARRQGFRAIVLETQTNNVPACKFYARMGCQIEGLREAYYSNDDMALGEVAIFWIYRLV